MVGKLDFYYTMLKTPVHLRVSNRDKGNKEGGADHIGEEREGQSPGTLFPVLQVVFGIFPGRDM